MLSRGDIQKSFSNILAEVKAQGYKLEDIIPEEMVDHFQTLTELKTAREYIKEMESREKDLRAENANLLTKLKAQADTNDELEEYESLKVDLQQAQRSIEYYKELAANATKLSERYQRLWKEAAGKQKEVDDAALKNERLEDELFNMRGAYLKAVKESIRLTELAEKQREQSQKLIEEKDKKLAALTSHANVVEAESEQFSETFTALLDTLETEQSSAMAAINDKSMLLRQTDKLYSAIVSEIVPLNRFYTRAFDILGIYQSIFRSLSDPSVKSIINVPPSLETLMKGAADDVYVYEQVHWALQSGGVAEEAVRVQLDAMATNAKYMNSSLESIKGDVTVFLSRLRCEPAVWAAMKGKFGGVAKWKRLSIR